jgi:hypothetical protein
MTSAGSRAGASPASFSITSMAAPRMKSPCGKIAEYLETSRFDPDKQ